MKSLSFLMTLVFAATAGAGFIDPGFSGPGSTTQTWEFSTGANPAVAESFVNPFGDPVATITGDALDMWWIDQDTNTGRQGVWKTEGSYMFVINNTDVTGPDTYKDIVVQIVYDSDPLDDLVWLRYATPSSIMGTGALPDTRVALGDGYSLATWSFRIEPNPTEEAIYLLPYFCNLYVDSVRIDTVCVPEPASMCVMGLGGLLVLVRKKR